MADTMNRLTVEARGDSTISKNRCPFHVTYLCANLVSALATQFNRDGIYSMLVRVLKHNPYRRFYSKINGTYLKTVRMPFAGEVMEVEIYGWLDALLTWQ